MQRDNCCVMYGCRYVYDYATLKEACELPEVSHVRIVEDIMVSATIAPTSYTHIEGFGHVQLDWSGAAGQSMFLNAAATNIVLSNLDFIGTGNWYYCVGLYANSCIINCTTGLRRIAVYASGCKLERVTCGGLLYVLNAPGLYINKCTFNSQFYAQFAMNSGYTVAKNTIIENTSFIPDNVWAQAYIIMFLNNAGPVLTMRSFKFNNCVFEPRNNGDDCIQVQDAAKCVVEDVSFNHCTFRDYNNCYTIPANPTVARWRFNNNVYLDEAGTRYNFTDPGDFVYTNDG